MNETEIMPSTSAQASSRILVADDDPTTRHLVTAILKKEGHCVVAVSNGREAIRILQSDSNFKAAILDINMPHLEGTEILRYMRTEKRLMRIPVILMTSNQSLTIMKDGFSLGASAFLSKPFQPAQLQTVVRMLLSSAGETTAAQVVH